MSEQTKNLLGGNYNPDVLECLANLSNDEVFTPPKVVNRMLDMLPPETWSNPNLKFLDPACKTGVFLREIAKRLIVGLKEQIPDLQQRLDHIFHNQLYGIAITELTALASRRSLYCSKYANGKYSVSKFDNPDGNIRFMPINHTWENGKCKYCGASASQYQRADDLETHAYEFIHTNNPEEIFGMKFDVIIGNPPYQMNDGGAGASAKPIYHLFVKNSIKLKPRLFSMIIPARWYAGGKGLDDFRADMLNDAHISKIIDYPNPKDCFPSNNVSGGIMYFLWDSNYCGLCDFSNIVGNKENTKKRKLNEFDFFIRYNDALSIIYKVKNNKYDMLPGIITSRKPFGLDSFERGHSERKEGDYVLISSKGVHYIEKERITSGQRLVNKYKVIIGKALSGHIGETDENGQVKVLAKVDLLKPGEVCTESYLCIGSFDDKDEAVNLKNYLCTKFARFLLLQALTSMNITKDRFCLVPKVDFSKSWNDNLLYKEFGLDDEEITLIESMIKPMEDK